MTLNGIVKILKNLLHLRKYIVLIEDFLIIREYALLKKQNLGYEVGHA